MEGVVQASAVLLTVLLIIVDLINLVGLVVKGEVKSLCIEVLDKVLVQQ